jgi:YesN/AraC family two-component response regulator
MSDDLKPNSNSYVSPDLELVKKLQQLIESHFRQNHDHEYYAISLHLTLTRLNRITKFYLEKTVYEMLQDRIHNEAKLLLSTTTLSSKEIAFELGICDPSYFGKCFRKLEGVTPKIFRKKHAKHQKLKL